MENDNFFIVKRDDVYYKMCKHIQDTSDEYAIMNIDGIGYTFCEHCFRKWIVELYKDMFY